MATVKKGLTVTSPEWWKHLRPFVKRRFWKRQRAADKLDATVEVTDAVPYNDRLDGYRQQFMEDGE